MVLHRALKKPLIWVSAPPGAGKTVLVSSFINTKKLKNLWYQIDLGDDDPATFFYYMGLAAKKAVPAGKDPLPLLTPEYLPGIAVFTKRYFESLYSQLKRPCTIVFDDYHELPDNSNLHELLVEGIALAPPGINIIIISRTNPPAEYSRLRAKDRINIIEWTDVQFTYEESKALVRSRGFKNMPEDTLKQLYAKTEGWAAGLVLMLERARTENIGEQSLLPHSNQDVFDYFVSEIFKKIDTQTQDFLMKASFLPAMTVEMAQKLSEQNSAGKILEALNNMNYFTHKHHGAGDVYQFHDLFREFLLARAKAYFKEGELRSIYEKAAAILEQNNKLEGAVELFRKSGSWGNIARIIKQYAQNLIAQGRNKVLATWLTCVPEEMLNRDPWLLYWFGEACAVFNPAQGRTYFEKAFRAFEIHGTDTPGIYQAWCGVIETFIYEYGNVAPMKKWIHVMEGILRRHSKFPSRGIEARVMSFLVFALIHYNPYHPKIELWANRTLALLKHIKDPEQGVYYLFSVVHYYCWTGNVPKMTLLKELIAGQSGLLSIKTQLMQKMYGTLIASRLGMKEECLRIVEEGLKIADRHGVHFLDHMIIAQAVYLYLGLGDIQGMKEYLQRMGPTVNRSNFLHVIQYDTLLGFLDYLEGAGPFAIEKIKRSLDLSIEAHFPFAQALCRLALAQVLYAQGDDGDAKKHYKYGLYIARRMKSNSLKFMAYCIRAYWDIESKSTAGKKDLKMLRKAMMIGEKYGIVNEYIGGQMLAKLSLKALENNIHTTYVQSLIQKLELSPDRPPIECENWPWKFKIYTLGEFRFLMNDKPLKSARKTQKKSMELLQAIIAFGGKDVHESDIMDLLWEDADGDRAKQALDSALYRFRKILNNNGIIIYNAGRLSLNARYCWTDTLAFESICDRIELILEKTSVYKIVPVKQTHDPPGPGINIAKRIPTIPSELSRLVNRLCSLYRGPFLGKEAYNKAWASSYRYNLEKKFILVLERAGLFLERHGVYNKAIEWYQKGLAVDNQSELLYRRLMSCYIQQGRNDEAKAAYDVFTKNMSASPGTAASAHIEEIYRLAQKIR